MATNPFGGGTQFRTEHTLTTPEFQQEAVRQVREFFGGRKPAPQAPALEIPQVSQATQGGLIEQPSPFQVKSPVAGDVSMFNPNPVTFKDQTPLGPLEMTLPSPAQQGMTPNVQLQEGMTVTPIGGQPQDVLPSSAPPTLTVPAPAPQGQQGLAAFGGRTLSEYLTDPTVKGAGLMTDPQGRMIDPNVDRSKFEELSAARSAAAGPNLTSIAGRPRPGVDVPSLAMQRERMAAGLDPVEGAPMGTGMSQQQQRDYLAAGRDPATGKKIETDDMTDYQKATLAQRQQQFEATQANINREWEAGQAALAEEKAQGIAGTQESIQKETDRLNSQLGFLEGAAMEMAGLSNWTTEGIIGAGIGKLPFETNKKQVDRIANSFMGNAFLRSIIDSKSLGATFGALSNQEGEKITGAETILMDGSMSNERRLRAAADIISTIKSAKTRAEQRMAKTQGSVKSAPSASTGSATPQMEGFTFTRKN